jgi:heterodisulfide reductase subunit D
MIGFFFGCTVLLFDELRTTLEVFFRKAGITYETVGVDRCCGIPLLLAGLQKEAGENGRKLVDDISQKGISTLVTSCPHCYRAFSSEFPHRFGLSVPFKTVHFTQYVADLYREPREVLASIPGLKMEEMEHNRDTATCCGGGGMVRAYLPILSSAVAREKVEFQARPAGVTGLVSSCPFCYFNLKEGAEEAEGGEMEVYDLAQLLVQSMEEPRDE